MLESLKYQSQTLALPAQVDFDQLKIENQQYMEKIEERNNELLRLKLSTSRTVQVSAFYFLCLPGFNSR